MNIIMANQEAIRKAVEILKKGGVIVYPTETAYALGADFFNQRAVKKVYQIKGRDYQKPLPIIVSSLRMAREVVKFDSLSLRLARRYWPGALTLVLESINQKINKSKNQTVGMRISSNRLATAIVKKFGRPITATSANIAGQKECYSITEVINQFKNKKYQPDLIIDAGKLPKRKLSTIVSVVDDKIKVLRKGIISIKSIKSIKY